MKLKNKIIAAAVMVALLTAMVCLAIGVSATGQGTIEVSFVSVDNGKAVVSVALTELTEGKSVDYAQITLTPKNEASKKEITDVTTSVENLGVDYQTAKDGSVTILAVPTATGVSMGNDTTVCSLTVSGLGNSATTLSYDVSYILCFTDGSDYENTVAASVNVPASSNTVTLQAETYGILNRYKVSGSVVGGMTKDASKMMTLEQLKAGKGMGNAVGHPMVSYIVEVEQSGTYTLEYVYNVATTSSYTVSDYALTVSINDQISTVAFAPRDAGADTAVTNLVGRAVIEAELVAGRNVIRMISCTADNAAMVSWMDHDYLNVTGNGKIAGVVATANHLLPAQSQYVNKWTVNTLTNTEAAGYEYRSSYLGGVEVYDFNGENLPIYELSSVPYVAYTVDVPADGYYNLGTHLVTKTATDADEGYVLLYVDGVKYTKHVVDNSGYIVNNNPMWTQYLTAGTHTIAITSMYAHSFDGDFWCDMAGLTVYGGITLADEQVDPLTWVAAMQNIHVSANGNDNNPGTAEAPVASLNAALIRVSDGGTITIDGTYAAPADFSWYATDKAVTVTGGTLDLSNLTTVNVNSSVTFKNMTLKVADNAEIFCNGHTTKINSDVTVDGVALIFGGVSTGTVASTDLTVLSGSWYSIYGGNGGGKGNNTVVSGEAKLTVGGNVNADITAIDHNEQNYIFAGSRRGSLAKTNVVFEGNAKAAKLFGGGSGRDSGDWCDVKNANITINGGQIYGVYGGNIFGPGVDDCTINITVNGGVIDQLFGGHEWAHDNLDGDVNIYLKGGTVNRRVYGGCYNQCDWAFDTDRHVIGNINVYVYGNFNMAYNSTSLDRSLYAHSRYNPPAEDENTAIYLMDLDACTKYANKLGAQDSTMASIMNGAAPADNIYYLGYAHRQWNVSLSNNIAANFYVEIGDSYTDSAVMHITVAGKTVEIAAKDAVKAENGYYVFTAELAAAQMTEEITTQMFIDGVAGEAKTYTIRQYADYILTDDNGEFTDADKEMVQYMLVYGGAAQSYFGYNTGAMASENVDVTMEEIPVSAETEMSVTGKADGIKFYGASLVFENKVAVRFYFTGSSEGIEGAVTKGDMFYVEVADILPQDLNKAVSVEVSGLSVSYSPMNYIVRMNAKGNDSLKALLKAMYNYHLAAVEYTAQ